jgi:DNA-directed RNA polymerase subunit RPC12/RpoP
MGYVCVDCGTFAVKQFSKQQNFSSQQCNATVCSVSVLWLAKDGS